MFSMNKKKLETLIRSIISETLDMIREAHQTGEWWIDDSGGTTYCDNQVTDQGHEAVVIQSLAHEILDHFGINEDEPGPISDYEETIKRNLMDDGRLTQEEDDAWENINNGGGPVPIIIKRLIEDKVYKDPKQAEDAVYIAYGSSSRDARDYAMKYWNWKVMKTHAGHIEIQTWHLKPEDLGIIVRGIWEIMDEDMGDTDDSDKEVGDDGYAGPRINVTVQAAGKRYSDIPLSVLEKKMPGSLNSYRSGADRGWTENVNEDYHHLHKEYRLYEGNKHIVAVFEDNSRLKFEVHYREKHGPDREKWRRKAFTTWKSIANEIHGDVTLSDSYNPVQKSWKQSFKEALQDPKLQEFVRKNHHQRIFQDKGYPAKVQGKPQPCVDPVNFTRMG